jgi:hypothetical protein
MNKWISVEDRLPDEDSFVVAAHIYYYSGDIDACVCDFFNGQFFLNEDGLEESSYEGGAGIVMDFKPTHWMTLPEPPKEVRGD